MVVYVTDVCWCEENQHLNCEHVADRSDPNCPDARCGADCPEWVLKTVAGFNDCVVVYRKPVVVPVTSTHHLAFLNLPQLGDLNASLLAGSVSKRKG